MQYAESQWTVIAGSFTSFVGAEVIDPTANTNFSRSILFYNEPFSLLGLRSTYAATKELNLIIGLNNGWDNVTDFQRVPTLELGMSYNPNPVFSLASSLYTGQERATPATSSGPKGNRSLFDLVATVHASEQLTFIANYDYGYQSIATLPSDLDAASWQGIAAYANYQFTDLWMGSLRGEYFLDHDGFRTGIKQNWSELSLTAFVKLVDTLFCKFRQLKIA